MTKLQTAAAFLTSFLAVALTLGRVESSSTALRALTETDTDTCINSCDAQDQKERFCGVDGLCHTYSCQAWYKYGPRKFTGYIEGSSPDPLICQDYFFNSGDALFYSGVQYGCYSTDPPRIQQRFTRSCSQVVSQLTTLFSCYEMATDTDFQPYLDEVASSGLTCENDTEIPEFGYKVTYSYFNDTGIPYNGITILTPGANQTLTFDATLAMNTMYSHFTTVALPEAPSDSPTSSPTNSPTSSAFAKTPVLLACMILVSLSHLILSVV
jgi:hypothetical protein